jgi:acylphosphatase
MARQRLEVRISGRVQGVWFRASTREEALRRGLSGWVRNLPDGRVEAVFEGDRPALDAMLAWCRVGPPGARVAGVETGWAEAAGEPATGLDGFTILR